MRVLLNTDVVLDFLLRRSPFFETASELFELNANDIFDAHISGITPINVFYIGRKIVGTPKIRQGIADLFTWSKLITSLGNLSKKRSVCRLLITRMRCSMLWQRATGWMQLSPAILVTTKTRRCTSTRRRSSSIS